MTLSEVSSLLPPPEGCAWAEGGPDDFYLVGVPARSYLRVRVLITGRITFDAGLIPGFVVAPERSEQEYLRALQAVGLAPDPEKEDLRRRLTWSEEMPTEAGDYLVHLPDSVDRPTKWSLKGDMWHAPLVGFPHPPPPVGARFLPLANLKERP